MTVDLTGYEIGLIQETIHTKQIDLYIKMNSRGKPLTNFEHFKSQFSGIIPDSIVPIFNQKIDNHWSDLFWNINKTTESTNIDIAAEVDQSFLNYYQ